MATQPPMSAWITGVGARGPLGLDALSLALCARAGKIEPRPTGLRDKHNHPIGVVRMLALPDDLHGFDRLVEMASPALLEAASASPGGPPRPLVVALPEAGRPDDDARFGPAFVEELARRSGASIDLARSEVVRAGHAGFAVALEKALVRDGDAVLVGGVDSYYHPAVLARLDADFRLHAPEAVDGLVPAEGAAFLLLEVPRKDAKEKDKPRLARARAAATALETTVLTGEPNIADAMTRLLRSFVEGAGATGIPWILTDVNSERQRAREWAMVAMRSQDLFTPEARQDRWVEELGDTGAASGALLAVLACLGWQTGHATAGSALIALHADGPERGVILLEAP
jgi:3-oxoacyl-[acyl-carrier-protein] synthase-1